MIREGIVFVNCRDCSYRLHHWLGWFYSNKINQPAFAVVTGCATPVKVVAGTVIGVRISSTGAITFASEKTDDQLNSQNYEYARSRCHWCRWYRNGHCPPSGSRKDRIAGRHK